MKQVLLDARLEVDGTDLSSHCSAVAVDDGIEAVSLMDLQGSPVLMGRGRSAPSITATLFQDFDASVDAVLAPLYESGNRFVVKVRSVGATLASATNPEWVMTARLINYAPLGGAVGEALSVDVLFSNAGVAGLERFTSPSP